jgi:hypothetical protein
MGIMLNMDLSKIVPTILYILTICILFKFKPIGPEKTQQNFDTIKLMLYIHQYIDDKKACQSDLLPQFLPF